MFHTILAALGPIVLGFLVGWFSGKYNFIKREYAPAFADFVVKIALPFALFLAAATSSPSAILNADYALALAVGLIGAYIVGYLGGKFLFKHNHADATMQGLSASFPDMAYCGPPVLLAAVGSAGLIAMVIGNLIYTVIIIPLALLALGSRQKSNSPFKSILHALSQPLVFMPICGAILAVCEIPLPALLQASVNELGETAGGVALFFLGLFLSGYKFKVNGELAFNVFVKNILQPMMILGIGIAVGLKGDLLISAFLIGVLPSATAVPALAVTNHAYEEGAASTVLLSTVFSLVSITGGIAVASML